MRSAMEGGSGSFAARRGLKISSVVGGRYMHELHEGCSRGAHTKIIVLATS